MGDTTDIIQKRIRHWKTTLAGVATIVCPIAAIFAPPDWQNKILYAAVVLSGTGHILAADAKPKTTVEPVQPTPPK